MAWSREARAPTEGVVAEGERRSRLAMFSALRHSNYRYYWFGQFPSVLAQNMQYVAISWLVLELSNSPLLIGVAGLAQSAPQIALTFVGGAIADRADRRRLLITTQGLCAVLFFMLGLMANAHVAVIWHVMVFATLLGAVRAFDQPSRQALLPQLIPRSEIANAVPLGNVVWQSTRLVGPGAAGLLIATLGVGMTLLVAGCGFLVALALFSMIRLEAAVVQASKAGVVRDMFDGLDFIRRHDIFAALIGLTFFNSVFGLSFVIMLPIIARDVLRVGSWGYGALSTASAIGSIAGTLMVFQMGRFKRRGRQALIGSMIFGCLVAGFALSPWFLLSMVLMVLMGTANQVYMTTINTTLQMNLPNEFRGRVMGIWGLTWSMMPLGGTVVGAIAEVTSPTIALASGGILVSLMALACLIWVPSLRNIE